jgi:hypothetical protein
MKRSTLHRVLSIAIIGCLLAAIPQVARGQGVQPSATSQTPSGRSVDLSKALKVTDVLTGYYDEGVKDAKIRLVPSITFRLHNKDTQKIGPVQVTAAFWRQGDDGEWDSIVLQGIHGQGLPGGATTESLLARANVAYTLEGARADFLSHHLFQNVTAKLFASQAGHIVPIGQYKLNHVIIPHLQ